MTERPRSAWQDETGLSAPGSSSSPRATAAALLLLVLLTCLFFHSPLFSGRNFYVWDLSMGYLPVQVDNARLRADGEFPLWNRHIALGYPISAEPESGGLYPPALLFNLIEAPGRAFTAYVLFHYVLALIGMVCLARVLGMGVAGQAVSALVLVFGGSFVAQTVNLPLVTTLAWTPLIVALLLRSFALRSYRVAATAGLLFGVQTLGAHFQISLYTVLLLVLCAILCGGGNRRFAAAATALLVGIGLGLGAAQILYTLDLMRFTDRGSALSYETQMTFSLPPHYLFQLLVPDLLGSERDYVGTDNIYELRVYFGLVSLGLLALGWRARNRYTSLFRVTLGAALFLALGRFVGVYKLLGLLPGFQVVRAPARFLLFASLGAAVLAGLGIERLFRRPSRLVPAGRRLALFHGALALLLVLVALLGYVLPRQSALTMLGRFADTALADRDAFPGVTDFDSLPSNRREEAMESVRRSSALAAAISLLAAGLWLWASRRGGAPGGAGGLGALVVILLAGDLFVANVGFHRFGPSGLYRSVPPEIEFLRGQEGLWRVSSRVPDNSFDPDPSTLIGNAGALYGIDSTSIWWSADHERLERYCHPASGGVSLKELSLFNVRFLLLASPSRDPSLHRRFSSGGRILYELADAQPRAAVRERYEIVHGLLEIKRRINAAGFRLGESVVLEERPSFLAGEPVEAPPADPVVEVTEYRAQRIRIDALLPRPGILVVADLHHPGWLATSNGHPAPVLVANAVMRGIALGPGRHRVELRYRPRSFAAGLAVSVAVGLALCAWGGASALRRRRRPASPAQ